MEAAIVEIKRRLTAHETEVMSEQPVSVGRSETCDDVRLLRSHVLTADVPAGRPDERVDGAVQRLDRVEERMDRMDQRLDRLEQRLSRVEAGLATSRSEFTTFRRDLPGLIVDAMREMLKELRSR